LTPTQLGEPPAEALLGRPEFGEDIKTAATWLNGKRVLITGAGGSIGWPLAHAVLAVEPTQLVLLDHHEYSLFSLERALGAASEQPIYELADVRDAPRLERVFDRYRPQVILHLAAAKHVQYGQRFPEGAVASNVLATMRLLEMATASGVESFVYPSSDKSVGPPGLYGATKRLAEALVQAHASRPGWSVVRYVNIIGTRGSVIETFTQQILDDRPLSVTDDRMTRYWISMNEALWCLIVAAERGLAGEVLMPACGEPIAILESAQRLAAWYRPAQQPYPIRCTGIRPGERLHEVLLSANEWSESGPAAGLQRVRSRREQARLGGLGELVEELGELVDSGERERLIQRCMQAAEALQ
jgi:FlaA1/EpsC-like NDP-sugar epimerase